MRFMLSALLLLALASQLASAQEHAAELADIHLAGWITVLEAGTLGRLADIVPVDGGFAVSAEHLPEESTEVQIVNAGTHAVFIQYPG